MSYQYLLSIAIILLSTKILGIITKKCQMPQVVGALLAGLIFGPACLNILHETEFLKQLAELGVIALMFVAGLETDIEEMKHSGKSAIIIAVLGVVIPVVGGFFVAKFFCKPDFYVTQTSEMLQNVFIGVILTATSVSITVETLKELGKLSTRVGSIILGAALIDDILGIIALTIITSLADASVSIMVVLGKIVGFFVFASVVGMIFYKCFRKWTMRDETERRRYVVVAFTFCLLMAYIAEECFGVADITGAFIAGLIISNTVKRNYIEHRFETMSYLLLSPIFFASIGFSVEIESMSSAMIIFTIALVIMAVLTKILGCGLGARLCGYTTREGLQVGSGMVCRGEVALIVASKGEALGLLSSQLFAPIVIMVVITTVIAPILLKIVFKEKERDEQSKRPQIA